MYFTYIIPYIFLTMHLTLNFKKCILTHNCNVEKLVVLNHFEHSWNLRLRHPLHNFPKNRLISLRKNSKLLEDL